jgi:hypothetical protein
MLTDTGHLRAKDTAAKTPTMRIKTDNSDTLGSWLKMDYLNRVASFLSVRPELRKKGAAQASGTPRN